MSQELREDMTVYALAGERGRFVGVKEIRSSGSGFMLSQEFQGYVVEAARKSSNGGGLAGFRA